MSPEEIEALFLRMNAARDRGDYHETHECSLEVLDLTEEDKEGFRKYLQSRKIN